MENILIVVGILILIAGLAMKFTKRTQQQPAMQTEKREPSDNFDENKAKGDAFEKFVVLHFDTGYFTLKEWRSDKQVKGIYAVSNHFPDLEVEFMMRRKNITDRFAIECKYRSNYYKDGIILAKDFQLSNYKKYAAEIQIPVFIVLGLGGTADAPAEIFIVPLAEVKSTMLSKDFLVKYKRDKDRMFYWDTDNKLLK